MATTVIFSQEIKPWSVVRLTSIPGKNTSSNGLRGDFQSTAFIRVSHDISGNTPTGGDYDHPVPTSYVWDVASGGDLQWSDGIP
jgi:hypothetical protein